MSYPPQPPSGPPQPPSGPPQPPYGGVPPQPPYGGGPPLPPEVSQKKLLAGIMGIILGGLGVHRFVLGDTTGGQQLGFFGISILIAVGVAIETVKQIDGQLMMRNYEGFLNTKTTKTKTTN